MSIGMTYEEYWDGSSDLCKYYRKASELKRQEQNYFSWLQGAYVYQAILSAAPAYDSFSSSREPLGYTDELIPMNQKEIEQNRKNRERKQMEQNLIRMKNKMASINARKGV